MLGAFVKPLVVMSIIPTELLWIAPGFIMLMAAFLAGAAELRATSLRSGTC